MQTHLLIVMHWTPLLLSLTSTNAALLPLLSPRARGNSPPFEIPPKWLERAPPPEDPGTYRMVEFNDGPTADGEAGIGAEFETTKIQFEQESCGLLDTFKAKRKEVRGHTGTNYVLSVDTSVEQGQGKLSAEYVLDGRRIKVGQDMAAAAGKAAYEDLANWTPWSENPANQILIDGYQECPDPWKVTGLDQNLDKDEIYWAPQVTTPMPLEALYFLMKENLRLGRDQNGRHILNGESLSDGQNLQLVTKDQFQPLKDSVSLDDINDAVLGFCTLILSYAKAADKPLRPNDVNAREKSPKSYIPFMPRTDFVTIYETIKTIFPLCSNPDDENAFPTELLDIFDLLACYKTKWDENDFVYELDTKYCSGTKDKPVPSGKFKDLQYEYVGKFADPNVPKIAKIADWIEGIARGEDKPDLITAFDKHYDSSIGGLGAQLENMYKSGAGKDRAAPLFEFRGLFPQKTKQWEEFMGRVDEDVQKLHTDFATRPWRKGKRDGNSCQIRNATSTSTATPVSSGPPFSNRTSSVPPFANSTSSEDTGQTSLTTPTSSNHTLSQTTTAPPITPAPTMPSCTLQHEDPDQGIDSMGCICGSSTLPLLTISNATTMDQSCSYTAMPTGKVSNPISIESHVYTNNCYPCTLVGGIADTPSCATTPVSGCTPTTPAVPTATVFLSNNTVPIGDKNNANNGSDFRTELYTKLQALCPDNANTCDSTKPGEFDHIETVVGDEPIEETVKFTIQDSHYDSPRERDQLIAAAVATWQQAVSKTCKEVPYEDSEDLTASGCGTGPVKRGTLERALMTPEERRLKPRYALPEPVCDNCSPAPPPMCHYKATICSGPDHINPILGNARDGPYANHMNIQLAYEIGHGSSLELEFLCDAIIEGLTVAAMIFAPELAGLEIWEDLELEALCASLGEQE